MPGTRAQLDQLIGRFARFQEVGRQEIRANQNNMQRITSMQQAAKQVGAEIKEERKPPVKPS